MRDAQNQTLMSAEGAYRAVWSRGGTLMFCSYYYVSGKQQHYALSLWDGDKVVEVARGHLIAAQWQGGDSVYCSDG